MFLSLRNFVLLFGVILPGVGYVADARESLNMSGIHFVMSIVQNPPYERIIKGENGSLTLLGVTRHINDWLAQRLQYTISLTIPPEEEVKQHGWTLASFMQLNKGEANLTASSAVITPERRSLVNEITFPMFEESIRMLVPRPSEEDRLFAFILPFDLWVWVLLLGTSLLAVVMMSFLVSTHEKLASQSNPQTFSNTNKHEPISFTSLVGTYTMYVVDVLTNHGDYLKYTNISSFLILVTFWLLGISVLIFSYSSIVVSSLTAPRLKPSINSYEDLAASQEVALIIRTDLVPTKRVLDGETPVYKQIAEKARKYYPESITHDIALTDKLLSSGRYAFTWLETYVRFFVATQYKKEKKCRFQMSKTFRGSSYYYHQYMRKGLEYRDALRIASMQLWETGLTRFWTKSLLPRAEECFANNAGVKGSQAKIKLVDLTSAFFILGVGLGAALIAFFCELSYHLYCSRSH